MTHSPQSRPWGPDSTPPVPARHPAPGGDWRQLRIGDAERDNASQALSEHFAAGRLRQDELDARLEAAVAARTYADLDRLFVDLPALPGRQGGATALRTPGGHVRHRRVGPFPLPLVLLVGLFLVGASDGEAFFPIFLALAVWFVVRPRARARSGADGRHGPG